jgi:hypothetical protein
MRKRKSGKAAIPGAAHQVNTSGVRENDERSALDREFERVLAEQPAKMRAAEEKHRAAQTDCHSASVSAAIMRAEQAKPFRGKLLAISPLAWGIRRYWD